MGHLFGFLFARPSFAEGVARLIDVGHTLDEYNRARDGAEADAIAMRADWHMVGDDLRSPMREVRASVKPRLNGARQQA